jgi:hypothetical protein
MEYSIGELIDKLVVIHLKIWHLEERIGAGKGTLQDKEIEEMCDQVVNLNTTRTKIIESIDRIHERQDG